MSRLLVKPDGTHRHVHAITPERAGWTHVGFDLHRRDPPSGFGQRVFTQDGSLDETMAGADHDVVLVPRGHHPCAAPYGIEMCCLDVMTGPRRAWRFANHPDFDWIARRDASS